MYSKKLEFTRCKLLATLVFMGSASSAMAYTPPMLVDQGCPSAALPADNNNGVHYNADCSVGYVPPPSKGTITTDYYQSSSTLALCPGLDSAYDTANIYTAVRKSLAETLASIPKPSADPANALLEAYDNAKAAELQAQGNYDIALQNQGGLLAEFTTARTELSTCLLTADPLSPLPPVQQCDIQYQAYLDARTAYVNYTNNTVMPAQLALNAAKADTLRAKLAYDREFNAFIDATARITQLTASILALEDQARQALKAYVPITGAKILAVS